MNRSDLRLLARIRLDEARTLLNAGYWDGAYYLTGYAAECGLKACIAKQVQRHDFPDKNLADKVHVHKLVELLRLAKLDDQFRIDSQADPQLRANWDVAKDWTEISRYERRPQQSARDLYFAVAERRHGVLRWIRRYW